ncbi:MAG: hypothetical protein HKN85_00610 [Gammaproteobacteria bacterium]|nr:hypothetical protein [Gammaproteobacteria bacterium]
MSEPDQDLESIAAREFAAPGDSSPAAIGTVNLESEATTERSLGSQSAVQIASGRRWWYSQFNLMLGVFALLALAAILFVLLAPPPELNQAAILGSTGDTSNSPQANNEAPWNQQQRAQARSESQTILTGLLANKKSLENKNVLNWAPERFQRALDIAAEGDEFYKQQNFAEAIKSYQTSSAEMESLFKLLPAKVNALLTGGENALNDGKSALAKELFGEVLTLDSGNPAATAGLDRARKLDEVLQLIATANQYQTEFSASGRLSDLQSAEQNYLQANSLDPKYKPATEGLAWVRSAILDKRFQLAMSKAYRELFANRYAAARNAFAEALKIKPGDQSAAAAMQQSLASDKTATLSSLLTSAQSYESREEWAAAQSNYQTALERDPNQVGAKLGELRTRARSRLDQQIRELLADTLSFGRAERKNEAMRTLADAKAISNKGPRLRQQIAELEQALQQSDVAIKVSLVSDNLTEVSLQKIGSRAIKLGQFSNKNLALKPGRYVATGVRLGYQDVRTEIELFPGNENIRSITIRCDTAVGATASRSSS